MMSECIIKSIVLQCYMQVLIMFLVVRIRELIYYAI